MDARIAEYLNVANWNDWWNPDHRIEIILDGMRQLNLARQHVLDLGCRFGLYSYIALGMGAASVTGVDIDCQYIDLANRCFSELKIPSERYHFSCAEAECLDFNKYTVILAPGLLYNARRQEYLMQKIQQSKALALVEFWTGDDNECNYPSLKWYQHDIYTQYFTNIPYIMMLFKRHGLQHKWLNSYTGGHKNVFFLVWSGPEPEPSRPTWGMDANPDRRIFL